MIAVEPWFWGTPEWATYLAAYERPHDPHFGVAGNLVVPLGDERSMQMRLSKGHRAAIGHAMRRLAVRVDDFWDYREIHVAANGHVRPLETYMVMSRWIPEHAHVWIARENDVPAAAAYFIHHERGVYYASGPRHPLLLSTPGAAHLLIWSAMSFYAAAGYAWMDMGPAPDEGSSTKVRSISDFKRHFGGEVRKWPY